METSSIKRKNWSRSSKDLFLQDFRMEPLCLKMLPAKIMLPPWLIELEADPIELTEVKDRVSESETEAGSEAEWTEEFSEVVSEYIEVAWPGGAESTGAFSVVFWEKLWWEGIVGREVKLADFPFLEKTRLREILCEDLDSSFEEEERGIIGSLNSVSSVDSS